MQTSGCTQYATQNPLADPGTRSGRQNPQLPVMCNMSPQATAHSSAQQKQDICGFTLVLYKPSQMSFLPPEHTHPQIVRSTSKPITALMGCSVPLMKRSEQLLKRRVLLYSITFIPKTEILPQMCKTAAIGVFGHKRGIQRDEQRLNRDERGWLTPLPMQLLTLSKRNRPPSSRKALKAHP